MSPRTSTWTETLGSSDECTWDFGGECLMYRLGNISRTTVKVVEAITASVSKRSNIFRTVALRTCSGSKIEMFRPASLMI
jgi:hypothetical protein